MVLKVLRELKEKTGKQFNKNQENKKKIRSSTDIQNTKNQAKRLELKNTIAELKDSIESSNSGWTSKRRNESMNLKTDHLKLSRGVKRVKNEKE